MMWFSTQLDRVRRNGVWLLLSFACALILSGCNLLSQGSKSEKVAATAPFSDALGSSEQQERISNPQAREIRFDGQELVLGGGDCQSMPVNALREIVMDLRERGRNRSASEMVRLHRRSSSRWVMESVASPDDTTVRWVAAILDRNTATPLHTQLCDAASNDASAAQSFDAARRECIQALVSGTAPSDSLERLLKTADQLKATLASAEAERLAALTEIAQGEAALAADRFHIVADMAADKGAADLASQAWLLASEAHLRAEAMDTSATAWLAAVRAQVTTMTQQSHGKDALPPLDTVFWEQVDRLRPHGVELPREVALATNPWKLRIGLGGDMAMTPKASLWSAVAAWQLTMGQPHLATLSIKRAEVEATDAAKPWLQVTLARSLAAQGQVSLATTVLGALTSQDDTNVRASALAALGSIKVQAGAYEQGGRFLIQALSVDGAAQWPGRLAAEADLANVRLIVGELAEARAALHSVQQKLTLQGRWQSLVQSLENEAAILELDGDKRAAKEIRERILEVERQPV